MALIDGCCVSWAMRRALGLGRRPCCSWGRRRRRTREPCCTTTRWTTSICRHLVYDAHVLKEHGVLARAVGIVGIVQHSRAMLPMGSTLSPVYLALCSAVGSGSPSCSHPQASRASPSHPTPYSATPHHTQPHHAIPSHTTTPSPHPPKLNLGEWAQNFRHLRPEPDAAPLPLPGRTPA